MDQIPGGSVRLQKPLAILTVRVRPELAEWLQQEAEREYRSMNAQLNSILDRARQASTGR